MEEAKYELRTRLQERCGRLVPVQILADLLDVRDEKWHNAIEGYMGNNKLLLVVTELCKRCHGNLSGMDKKRFSRAAVLDTEKVLSSDKRQRQVLWQRRCWRKKSMSGRILISSLEM